MAKRAAVGPAEADDDEGVRKSELDAILGGQRIMITKLLDTWDSLKIPEGRKAAEEEVERMLNHGVWDDPVEQDSIEDDAIICKLKLLISCKYRKKNQISSRKLNNVQKEKIIILS